MKLKIFSLSMIGLLVLSAGGVVFANASKKSIDEVEASYSVRSVPTTIDLNASSDESIRDYYSELSSLDNNEKTGTNLLKNLKPILKNGQQYFSYGESATKAVWQAYEIVDRDWEKSPASEISGYNANKNIITGYVYGTGNTSTGSNPYIHALYINRNAENNTRAWGDHSQTNYGINQEHVWAKARGFDDKSKAVGARGDLMHLWAGNGKVNGAYHKNFYYGYVDKSKSYDNAGTEYSYLNGNLSGYSATLGGKTTVFEPQDSDKGDIARAIFYMAARYNYLSGSDSDGIDASNPNLEIVNDVSSWTNSGYTSSTTNTGKMGILSDLLEWNRLDPPDEWEIHRNDLLYTNFTNNRNPFIDFPDWAEYIWGDKAGSKYANPNSDTIHSFSTGGGEPPEPQNIPVTGINLLSSATIKVDGSIVLSPEILPHNATNKAVNWYSDDTNIATVDNGRVTGKAVGTVTISATTVDGSFEANCEVTVNAKDAVDTSSDVLDAVFTGIQSTNSYSDWSDKVGTTSTVYAGCSANSTAYNELQMRTSDDKSGIVTTSSVGKIKKVTVDWGESCVAGRTLDIYGDNTAYTSSSELYGDSIKGTKLGSIVCGTSTELTITEDYKYIGVRSHSGALFMDSITFDWNILVSNIELDETSIQLDLNGETEAILNANVLPENAANTNITWSSGNEEVATVDDGVVTAKAVGETTITVTSEDGNATVTCVVTVVDTTPPPTKDVTIDTSIMAIASANGWENSGWYGVGEANTISIDENISFYTTGTTNNGRYYTNGNNWRLYHAGEGNIVIKAGDGYTIKSVTLNFSINKDGYLIDSESHTVESGQVNDVNASSVTYTVAGPENGQVRITNISVTYSNSQTPSIELSSIAVTDYVSSFTTGDTFNFGGTVTATYSDSTTKNVTGSASFSGYDMSKAGTQTVTVAYTEAEITKTTSYEITVNEPTPVVILESISITTNPTKLEYEVGEMFSSEGLIVTAIYSDGTSEAISDYSLSTVDTSTVGEKTVTITYQGHTATFTINVYKTLSSISVSGQTTTFEKGDTFTFGGTVTATYTDGSTLDVTSSVTFGGYDMSNAGVQTVTVTYVEGDVRKTVTYQITVNEPVVPVTLTGISITTNPTKLEYVTGEDLDLTGMVVTATYSDGSTSLVNDYTVSGYDKNNIGTQTITVTYQGFTKTFTVVVNDGLKDQKDAAVAALNEYYNSLDLSKYSFDNLVKLYSELKAGESAIKNAKSVDEINAALANAKNALASIPQEETPEPPTASTNTCGGNIAATSAILSLLALLGVALVTYKKRKQ